MDKKEFNKIRRQVSKMTDEEKEELMALIDSDNNKEEMQVVESILDLVSANAELVKECGIYVDEYYQLPIKNRSIICGKYCDSFLQNGNDINNLFMLISHEADHLEESVDPVVEAIREANVLIKKNPNINTSGIRYE